MVSPASVVYRHSWLKLFRPKASFFDLIKVKITSKVRIKQYVEIGSPCRAQLWSEKYFAVLPPFITYDSESFNKIFAQSIKSSPKPYLQRTANQKQWFNYSKTFWKSILIKYPFIFSLLQISIISESKRPISLINLPFINAVWWASIKEWRNFLSLASNPFYIIFSSRFNKEMGLQLQINLYLDLVFLIMMTWICEVLRCFTRLECDISCLI